MTNLRELAENKSYFEINREERNFAALFYHLLLQRDNLEIFINKIKAFGEESILEDCKKEYAVYYEYAFIRDLWSSLDESMNMKKRGYILNFLGVSVEEYPDLFDNSKIAYFNAFFGASRAMSKKIIVSPANWSSSAFNKNMSKELFAKACELKWCFNAKPDIVIHTSKNSAICIEAKLESGQGNYKASANGLFHQCGQLEIQRKLMSEILGLNCEYLIITKNKPKYSTKYFSADNGTKTDTKLITWKFVFELFRDHIDTTFLNDWKNKNEQLQQSRDPNPDEFIYVVNTLK